MEKRILINIIITAAILIGVSFTSVVGYRIGGSDVNVSSTISIHTKLNIEDKGSIEDCDCYIEEYPPLICGILRSMIHIIGVTGDVMCLILIYLGFSKETLEKIFSPIIEFRESLLQLWFKLDCPP